MHGSSSSRSALHKYWAHRFPGLNRRTPRETFPRGPARFTLETSLSNSRYFSKASIEDADSIRAATDGDLALDTQIYMLWSSCALVLPAPNQQIGGWR